VKHDLLTAWKTIEIIGALVYTIWIVRRTLKAARIIRGSEVSALRWVSLGARTDGLSEESRKLVAKVAGKTDPWLPAGLVIITPRELAALAPFIDDKLQAYSVGSSASEERIVALTRFKQRTMRQGFWPGSAHVKQPRGIFRKFLH
jgi:hypothetical protein